MNYKAFVRTFLALLLTALAGCSKSPSEPKQTPSTPVPPVPVVGFVVSVTASPGALAVGGASGSTITVTARSSDTGAPPPDGTQVKLTTTLGEFGSQGSGLQTTTLVLVGGRAQAVLFPGPAAGTASIQAQLQLSGASGSGAATVVINQATTFFVGSVSPSVGSPQGGDRVTITGGGFVGPVRVTFNQASATVLSVTPNRITAIVPSATAAGVNVGVGQSVPVTVSVTINVNQTGTASDSLNNGFTYSFGGTVEQPQIFSVSPATGSNDGGTRVTITGTGFSSPVQVFFEGGSPKVSIEAAVVSVTSSQIVVLTPPARGFGETLANNPVDIRVKNLNSGFETTAAAAFRFGSKVLITAVGPGQLDYNDTTTLITVQGQGFAAPVAVSIAGVAARVVSVSGTEIVVQSPGVVPTSCQDVTGGVVETNINTGDGDNSSTHGLSFVYRVPKLAITGINPTSGGQNGGTTVTLSGSGLSGPDRVQFGDQAVTSTPGSTPGTIVVSTPAFSGTFPTITCTAAGGVQGTMNVPTSVDVKVTNLATTCQDTLSKAFTYNPSDTSCQVAPTPPPGAPSASFNFAKAGLTVTFVDTSTNDPTSWTWDFGDPASGGANTSNAENPTHTFSAPGNYVVKLTVSNSGGSSSTNQLVTVP
jgi:PKD repeat protein